MNNLDEVMSVIKDNPLVMLVASTKDCGVCTAIKPRLMDIISKYNQVESIYIYVDELVEASGEFMVFTVPTVILFAEGREVHRESRFVDFAKLEFELSRWAEFMEKS